MTNTVKSEKFVPSNKTYEEKCKIINSIRARIIANDRALSGLLTFVKHVVLTEQQELYEGTEDGKKYTQVAYTDGDVMYFGDLFFSQEIPIMCAIVFHELLHIVFRHVSRATNKRHKLFNIATDAIINDSIGYLQSQATTGGRFMYLDKEHSVSLDGLFEMIKLPSSERHPVSHWTAESLYEVLLNHLKEELEEEYRQQQQQQQQQQQRQQKDKDKDKDNSNNQHGDGTSGGNPRVPHHQNQKSSSPLNQLEQEVEELLDKLAKKYKLFNGSDMQPDESDGNITEEQIQNAIWTERFNRAKSMSIGSSSILAQIRADIYQPQIPWAIQLRKFLIKRCMPTTERTYQKPNRRMISMSSNSLSQKGFTQPYLPGVLNKKGLDKIVIIVDTSGSCFNNEEQVMFATEIQSIQQTTGVEIQLIFADSEVTAEYCVKNDGVNFLEKLRSGKVQGKGGGGTDMVKPLLYAVKKYKPLLVVIATDCYTPFPSIQEMRQVPQILWISNTRAEAPKHCGITLHIKPNFN